MLEGFELKWLLDNKGIWRAQTTAQGLALPLLI